MSNQSLTAFPPHSKPDAVVLILGSMPGVASLQARRYYAHPRNAFWPILCSYFTATPKDYASNLELLTANKVALWDVVQSCVRPGSLDSAINANSVVCNDFATFLHDHQAINHILFNGKAAEKLFKQHIAAALEDTHPKLIYQALPSTSPAMATLKIDQKKTVWHAALKNALMTI